MAFEWVALALTLVGIGLSRLSPSVPEMRDKFGLAQKYYAAKDYDTGVQLFRELVDTPSNPVLNVDTLHVWVDDLRLPLHLAATYQLGNSDRNMGAELLERAQSALSVGDTTRAAQRKAEAFAALRDSRGQFGRLVREETVPPDVRVMSQYQIIRADYTMEEYRAVIQDVRFLLEAFPGSEYEDVALYDMAWAQYNLEEYTDAIKSFQRVLEVSKDVVRRDRSVFQTAESYSHLGDQDTAIVWFERLVNAYDFTAFTEREIEAMKALKIRGVVRETTRELVAKAQIRIGELLAGQGRVEEAIEAYARVPLRYPQEQLLVEQAYSRAANLILERRGLDAGIRAYQQAIENVDRKAFQATIQLQIARALFDAQRYREAVDAYQVYAKAYGDVARAVGFDLDKTTFKIADGYRSLGVSLLEQDSTRAAEALRQALVYYDALLAEYAATPLRVDAESGRAATYHALGQPERALGLYLEVADRYPDHPAAPSALLQAARIQYASKAPDEAARTYERLIRQYPSFEWIDVAHAELGVVYRVLGEIEEAVASLRRVRRSAADWVKVRAEIGEILTSVGRYSEALEGLDEAIAAGEGSPEVVAELQYTKGKIAYSEPNYAQAVSELTAALEHTTNRQLEVSARFMRGLAYYELGKALEAPGGAGEEAAYYERSAADLTAVLDSDPPAKMRGVAYRTLGTAMIKLGRSEETIRTYTELIATVTSPEERAVFQHLLMELYYDQGRFVEAIRAAEDLLGWEFTDTNEAGYFRKERAYSVLGGAHLELKQYTEAVAAAKEGLSRYPDSGESASLAFTIGLAYYGLEDYAEAAASFEVYLKRFPRAGSVLLAYYYAGQSCQILGEYEKAADAFGQVAQRFPDSPQAPESLFLRGENLYNALDFGGSQGAFQELLARYPRTEFADDALYSLAWVEFDLGEMQDGVRTMESLTSRFPQSPLAPRAQYTIGDYYYGAKEYTRAQEAYRRVMQAYPESEEAAKARALVAELDEERASQLYDTAFSTFERGDYARAVEEFQRVVAGFPNTYAALSALANMAVAWEHLGDRKQARQLYDRVIAAGAQDQSRAEVVRFAQLRLERL